MREKLIELVNNVLRCLPWGEISSHTAEDVADHLIDNGVTVQDNTEISEELLKQLRNAPVTILQEEPTIEVVQEWISVKDRLPEYGERVIACGVNGGVFMVKATTTPGFGKVDGASKYRTFAYWMPLPQPPKGE